MSDRDLIHDINNLMQIKVTKDLKGISLLSRIRLKICYMITARRIRKDNRKKVIEWGKVEPKGPLFI